MVRMKKYHRLGHISVLPHHLIWETEKTELIFQVTENIFERSLVSTFACGQARARSSFEKMSCCRCSDVSLTWISNGVF